MESIIDSRGRERVATENLQPSETIQSQADQADISKILQKYQQVGIVDHLNRAEAMFMDVTEFTDLADAMRQSVTAEVEFMKMPSKVREIFDHDVANWLDAAHDPEKRELLEEAGFIEKPKSEQKAAIAAVAAGVVPDVVEKDEAE